MNTFPNAPMQVPEITEAMALHYIEKGLGHNEYSVCKVQMTPVIAKALLERNPHNRPIRMAKVNELIRAIKDGGWHLTPQAAALRTDGTLGDGQHRVLAVLQSGIIVPMFVWFNMPIEVMTVLDTGARRTAADVFQLSGIGDANIVSSAARNLWKYREGEWSGKGGTGTNSEIVKAFNKEPEIADHIVEGKRVGKGLGISPGLATTLVYLTRTATLDGRKGDDPVDVDAWMEQVSLGEMLTRQMPAYHLRQTIQSWKDRKVRVSTRMHFGVYAKAWGSYVNREPIRALRFQEKEAIITIENPVRRLRNR